MRRKRRKILKVRRRTSEKVDQKKESQEVSRCRVPESGSSTPLLRTRGQFGVRGVDVVRTSLQTRYDLPSLYYTG